MTNETNSITEPIEGFSDNPMDIVRVIAGLAAQYASMSEAERRGQPSPVRPDSPIVRAAQRLCTVHGYAQDGNELPGFMERAARTELAAKIPRESNDKLLALARRWKLDGDWMTCLGCKRSLIASRDGEELNHADGCKFADEQHPWTQLRALIAHE